MTSDNRARKWYLNGGPIFAWFARVVGIVADMGQTVEDMGETMEDMGETMEEVTERVAYTLVTIHAGENGALTDGRWCFSWGDRNEQGPSSNIGRWGWVASHNWQLESLSIGCRDRDTNSVTSIVVTVNGVDTLTTLEVPADGLSYSAFVNSLTLSGVGGDSINFKCVSAGNANDAVVTAVLKIFLEENV